MGGRRVSAVESVIVTKTVWATRREMCDGPLQNTWSAGRTMGRGREEERWRRAGAPTLTHSPEHVCYLWVPFLSSDSWFKGLWVLLRIVLFSKYCRLPGFMF